MDLVKKIEELKEIKGVFNMLIQRQAIAQEIANEINKNFKQDSERFFRDKAIIESCSRVLNYDDLYSLFSSQLDSIYPSLGKIIFNHSGRLILKMIENLISFRSETRKDGFIKVRDNVNSIDLEYRYEFTVTFKNGRFILENHDGKSRFFDSLEDVLKWIEK